MVEPLRIKLPPEKLFHVKRFYEEAEKAQDVGEFWNKRTGILDLKWLPGGLEVVPAPNFAKDMFWSRSNHALQRYWIDTFCRVCEENGLKWTDFDAFLEIGGGIGTAGRIWHERIPEIEYIDVDLPKTLTLAMAYNLFYGVKGTQHVPNYLIADIGSESVDAIFNVVSMGEMTVPIVEEYFRQIRRILKPKGLFLNLNRDKKRVNWEEYPYLPGDEHLHDGFSEHQASGNRNEIRFRISRMVTS